MNEGMETNENAPPPSSIARFWSWSRIGDLDEEGSN